MNRKRKTIPQFKSLEEEMAFWDKHSLSELELRDVTPRDASRAAVKKPKRRALTVQLEERRKKQIKLTPIHVSDLPFRVLHDAYFVPDEAQLKDKYAQWFHEENVAAGRTQYARLEGYWRTRETWINLAFQNLLLASRPVLLASVFNRLIPSARLVEPQVYSCNLADLKAHIGVPDFIVADRHTLLLGELKVGAMATSHRYSFEQYTKYMFFAAVCKFGKAYSELPARVKHLILCPEVSPSKLCADYGQWKPSVADNMRLMVDPSKLKTKLRIQKNRISDFAS